MKYLAFVSVLFLIVSCSSDERKDGFKKFEHKFQSINEVSPYEINKLFIEKVEDTSASNPFNQFSVERVNSQFITSFKDARDENIKLAFDILVFEGGGRISYNQIGYLERKKMEHSKKDNLDKLFHECVDLAVQYQKEIERLELSNY